MTISISMRDMLEAGVHFGHQTRYWDPKMAPYIYGARHNIHIINLEESLPMFRSALEVIEGVARKRGRVLFVGTKHAARAVVREEATRCGMPYVDHRWLGGMLTNYKTIRQSVKRLKELEERLSDEKSLSGMTKKEVLCLMRAKEKLYVNLAGVKNMGGLPDLIFVIDIGMEKIAIQEAKCLKIPVIGIADTNANPTDVDYLIPGNDDAVRALRFYCKTIADVIIEARGAADLIEVERAAQKEAASEEKAKKKVVAKKIKPATVAEEDTEKKPVAEQSAPQQDSTAKKASADAAASAKTDTAPVVNTADVNNTQRSAPDAPEPEQTTE